MERVDYALLFRWVVGAEIDFKASHSIPYLGNRDPLCQAGIPNVLFDQIAQQAVSIRPGHLAVPRQPSVWRSASLLAAGCRGAGQVESAHVRSRSVCPGEAPRSRPSVGAPREGERVTTWGAPGRLITLTHGSEAAMSVFWASPNVRLSPTATRWHRCPRATEHAA